MVQSINLLHKRTTEDMKLTTFLNLPPSPFQRPVLSRIKANKVKSSLSKLRPEHLDVAIVELTKDCVDQDGRKHVKGTRFINNGNTRQYYWKNGLTDFVPEKVIATIYYCDSMQEVKENYNTFDSPNAVEKNAEKVAGIINGIYNYKAKFDKIKTGHIFNSLGLACHFNDPHKFERKYVLNVENATGLVGHYIKEIIELDKICNNAENWDSPLICAALMALKKYNTSIETSDEEKKKIKECIEHLDNGYIVNRGCGPYDGITMIRDEWNRHILFRERKTSWDKPDNSNSKNRISNIGMIYTVSFALYWIEKYMKDEMAHKLGNGWEKTGENFFSNLTQNALLNNFLTASSNP